MLYIHQSSCISPQQTFPDLKIDLHELYESKENKLTAREPLYEGIPSSILRRMGKTTRLGVGAALPLIQEDSMTADGIIIGTGNGGMEESIQFMKQIIDHEEGMLTPGTFVQSTPNTVASQISLLSRNKGYNTTHVQAGLAFENALIDATMLLKEHPLNTYLTGGVDEIGTYNYNIDRLQRWFKNEPVFNRDLYKTDSSGSVAGEGAAMFIVNNKMEKARAKLGALTTLISEDQAAVTDKLQWFLDSQLPPGDTLDIMLTGENGDNRLLRFFSSCESILDNAVTVLRYKHMSGEYPTASGFALWIGCHLLGNKPVPRHMIKRSSLKTEYKNILIYNNYKGLYHSFMLVSQIQ